ncbi:MAG: DUF4397 domain-containing protein [Acidobacteriota bacterium]|nr:MAG: DUF4397 domain-containing protein [Acidobacteriota bacterium]
MKATRWSVLLLAVALFTIGPATANPDVGNVWVVHGVPGLDVDVYVNYPDNAEPALPGFQFGQIVGPVELPPGDYTFDIYAAGADPSASDPVLSKSTSLMAGQYVSVVAQLLEDGTPTISLFGLDLRETAKKGSRLGLRHTAAAPAVDVVTESSKYQYRGVFGTEAAAGRSSFNSGAGASSDIPAGAYSLFLNLAGTDLQVFPADGTIDLMFEEGKVYYYFAVGVFPDSFTLLELKLDPVEGAGNGDYDDDDSSDDDSSDDASSDDDDSREWQRPRYKRELYRR